VAHSSEDTNAQGSANPAKKDVWEVLESASKIIAALGIPVVLGVGGWYIQKSVSNQTVSKDYVTLATSILQAKQEAGNDSAKGLRKWAVDLLNQTSPVPLDEITAKQLINGTITIPSATLATIGSTDILGVGSAITFESGMLIDADGAPHAFHPDDKSGLDSLINVRDGHGNWVGVVTDNNGQPVIQTAGDPAPGFYVSITALEDPSRDRKDPQRYVNSEAVNYIVIPGGLQAKVNGQGAKLGDFAAIIRPETGTFAYAIVADIGPRRRIGEGSIALAKALGIPSNLKDPDPKKRAGVDHGIVYIVFAGSGKGRPLPQEEINQQGAKLFSQWGGMDQAKSSFPKLAWR
jgi:hypothetical protein